MEKLQKKPNVIFIISDQMKANCLKMYSDYGIQSPNLKRLAKRGVLYKNAITPHPLCVPARTSIVTSRYPSSTGCRRNETFLPLKEKHAFEIWKQTGFKTGLIGKNHCYKEKEHINSFDVFCPISHLTGSICKICNEVFCSHTPDIEKTKGMDWMIDTDVISSSHKTRKNMPRQSPRLSYAVTNHKIEGYSTEVITRQTEAFIDEHKNEPFALWVSYPDPHGPYEVPEKYYKLAESESKGLPPNAEDKIKNPGHPERNKVLYSILNMEEDDPGQIQKNVNVYNGMVKFVDDGVGRIIDKIIELGLDKDTIIVFTADHGDFAGEHNMMGKGGVFYDCLVKVPLIISFPGVVPEDVVEENVVNTIDIVPTLLKLQSIEIPKRMQGHLLPSAVDAVPQKATFSEYGAGGPPFTLEDLNNFEKPFGHKTLIETLWAREAEGRRKMVRTTDWKYIYDPMGDLDELYDLINDPWEMTNLSENIEYSDIKKEMRAYLLEWAILNEDSEPVPLPGTIGREK